MELHAWDVLQAVVADDVAHGGVSVDEATEVREDRREVLEVRLLVVAPIDDVATVEHKGKRAGGPKIVHGLAEQ